MNEPSTANADESPSASSSETRLTVIDAGKGWRPWRFDLVEAWRYRELLGFLAWRDIKVRYKQAKLGAAWAILQPLATMVVLVLVLGRVPGVAGGEIPYSLFVLSGMIPWVFFATSVTQATTSLIGNQNLVTRVYFPRLLIPGAAVAAALFDFVVALVALAVWMLWHGKYPGWSCLWLPLILLGLAAFALAMGAALAALAVAYRDFRHAIPFLTQLWMFATPSVYVQSPDAMSPWVKRFLLANPLDELIDAFRSALLGQSIDGARFSLALALTGLTLVLSCLYFRRVERSFADVI